MNGLTPNELAYRRAHNDLVSYQWGIRNQYVKLNTRVDRVLDKITTDSKGVQHFHYKEIKTWTDAVPFSVFKQRILDDPTRWGRLQELCARLNKDPRTLLHQSIQGVIAPSLPTHYTMPAPSQKWGFPVAASLPILGFAGLGIWGVSSIQER